MRILSYNILNGGEGRADPLAEVIEAQNADIVALIEADYEPVLERIANRLKVDYIAALGTKHTVTLLSRYPIIETINHARLTPNFQGCFLEARLDSPKGTPQIIGVVHLHPHAKDSDEKIREHQLDIILKTFQPHRDAKTAHILIGDFNATSPVQKIDPKNCKPETQKEWQENGQQLPRRAIQKLLDNGYTDTLPAVHPTKAPETGTFTTQTPGQRTDYIFTHGLPKEKIQKAWVEQDRLAKYASDHFPIGAEM